MYKLKMPSNGYERTGILLIIAAFVIFLAPNSSGASPNDACFNCHASDNKSIDRALYDSNPHNILECVDCHVNSASPPDTDPGHGQFIRQFNGSNITGRLTTAYSSQNFSLCYYCHAEEKVVGLLPSYKPSSLHVNTSPLFVSSIGTNFINVHPSGYHNGSQYGGSDIPTNIHWNHLDDFGSMRRGEGGMFDYNMSGNLTSYQSCTACHNVHGTNYPRMTKNDLAISYGSDANGTFGYLGSIEYLNSGGDVYCAGCHTSGTTFKYYRTEINIFEDCVSCHADGVPGDVNKTAFGQGVHVNINTSEGTGSVNNSDCWSCHFDRDMNKNNIRQCADCHTGSGFPAAPQARTHLPAVTNYSCSECHSKVTVNPGAGIVNVTSHYASKPIVPTSNYCDYCHGPDATSPFPALNKTLPEFAHDDPAWNGNATCRTCHANSSVSADPLATDTSSFHDLTTELGDVNGTVKADCVLCHIQKDTQFVSAPDPTHDTAGLSVQDCYGCHGAGVSGTQPQQLHSVAATGGGACIACHSNNATRYYVNTSLFGRHANVNTTDGNNNVTDADCKTCHNGSAEGTMPMKLGAANASNTYFCDACHTSSGAGPIKPTDPALIKNGLNHGKADCKWCHIAGDSLPRPLSSELRYHPNAPKGTAAGKDCLSCHYYANLPDLPFHAPGETHASVIYGEEGCDFCHGSADNHAATPPSFQGNPPSVSGLSVTSQVTSGTPAQVQATVADDNMQIAAAQYRVYNTSGVVIDWTNMTPQNGRFDSSSEVVNASINTSRLKGTYTVNVKGMASAPKTDASKPYYPLNGQWSALRSTQLTVVEATGYANGTVSGSLGSIADAIVATNTSVFATTNASGFYSLSLPNGTYQLTASKEPEYYPNSSVIVNVTANTTVTRDILLTLKPVYTLSGRVTNASSGLGIPDAVVKLDAYPQYNATTNGNGDYSMSVPAGTYNVSASAAGYVTNKTTVTVSTNTVQNFILNISYPIYIPWTATTQGWTTPFVIANKGSSNANVEVNYYNQADGSNVGTYSVNNLQPGASIFVFREWTAPNTDGSAVLISDKPLTVLVDQFNNGQNKFGAYEVDRSGSTEVLLPWTATTQGWTTPYVIVNRGTANAAVNINYYNIDGSQAGSNSVDILPGASKFVFREWTAPNTDGAAKLTSNQPVSVLVDMFKNAENKFGAYIPASDADTQVFIPWTATTQGWSTPFKIVNRGSVAATVSISYYNQANGQPAGTDSVSIPSNGVVTVSRENSAAAGTDGSAVLSSTQPISVIVEQFNNNEGKFEVYTPAMTASNNIVIPWTATTQGWTTPYVIVNRGSVAANVNIQYYNQADGSSAGTYSVNNLQPGASTFVFREWTTSNTDGSAVLTSNQPITVMVDQFNNAQNKFGAYTPIG